MTGPAAAQGHVRAGDSSSGKARLICRFARRLATPIKITQESAKSSMPIGTTNLTILNWLHNATFIVLIWPHRGAYEHGVFPFRFRRQAERTQLPHPKQQDRTYGRIREHAYDTGP